MTNGLHEVMFVSRTKDNNNLQNFKQRKLNFVSKKKPEELMGEFHLFGERGIPGEISRFYYSTNARKEEKLKNKVQHYLLDNDDIDWENFQKVLSSLVKKNDMKAARYLSWDIDVSDDIAMQFKNYMENAPDVTYFEMYKTHTNWGAVSNRCDVRPMTELHPDITFKSDGDRFICSYTKQK